MKKHTRHGIHINKNKNIYIYGIGSGNIWAEGRCDWAHQTICNSQSHSHLHLHLINVH